MASAFRFPPRPSRVLPLLLLCPSPRLGYCWALEPSAWQRPLSAAECESEWECQGHRPDDSHPSGLHTRTRGLRFAWRRRLAIEAAPPSRNLIRFLTHDFSAENSNVLCESLSNERWRPKWLERQRIKRTICGSDLSNGLVAASLAALFVCASSTHPV